MKTPSVSTVADLPSAPPAEAPKGSAVDAVIASIKEGIKTGRFAPGQRLIEPELTRAYGVSRGPLREALRRLAADGYIELTHHRGASVRRLDREDVRAIFRIREVLEGLSASIAASRSADPALREELLRLQDAMDAAVRDVDIQEYYRLNEAFHASVVRGSRSEHLQTLIAQLFVPALLLQSRVALNRELIGLSNAEHHQITEAILAGDTGAAEASMRHHVRRAAQLVDRLGGPFL